MPSRAEQEAILVDSRELSISNPRKVLFPKPGYTNLDLVRYYLAVAQGALRGAGGRPHATGKLGCALRVGMRLVMLRAR